MGIFFSLWRRFFGGYDDGIKDGLESRGVQMVFCIIAVFCWEFFAKGMKWYLAILTAVLVYIYWCRGHWYYFQCGTESDKYIDDCIAKGRKPCMDFIVSRVNKLLGFKERSKQYCFVGLLLRYTLWAIPVSLLVGWQFIIAGLSVAFIYNTCFWVEFPACKIAKSPTNWAELITGFIIGWGLL